MPFPHDSRISNAHKYESHYFYRSQIDSKKTIISVLGLRAGEKKFPCSGLAMPTPSDPASPYSNAGVAGLLRSTPKKATFSLTATYSLSAYPNSRTICVLCIPLILLISAAE